METLTSTLALVLPIVWWVRHGSFTLLANAIKGDYTIKGAPQPSSTYFPGGVPVGVGAGSPPVDVPGAVPELPAEPGLGILPGSGIGGVIEGG